LEVIILVLGEAEMRFCDKATTRPLGYNYGFTIDEMEGHVSPNRRKAMSMPCLGAMKRLVPISSPSLDFQNVSFPKYCHVHTPCPVVQTTSPGSELFYRAVEGQSQLSIKLSGLLFLKQGYTLSFPSKSKGGERSDGRSQSNKRWLDS
jgi:hypothetical protein